MNPSNDYAPIKEVKYCFVPTCKNNSQKDKNKMFFVVPKTGKQEWCKALNVGCPKRALYICEAHLNLKEDVENYFYWSTVKGRPKLRSTLPLSLVQYTVKDGEVCERPSSGVPGTSTNKRQRVDKRRNVLPRYDDDSSDDDDSDDVANNSEGTLDVERIYVTLPKQDEDVPAGYKCNVCSSDIMGFRSTCLECADFNLCAACDTRGEHSLHYVLRIPAAKAQVDNDRVLAAIRKHIEDLLKLKEEINEADAAIIEEVEVKEEAMDEEPAEHVSEDTQPNPVVSYSIAVPREDVLNLDSQYFYLIKYPTRPLNSESAHPAQSVVNESWTSVGHGVNDALVPNVAQASSQCQEQDPLHRPGSD